MAEGKMPGISKNKNFLLLFFGGFVSRVGNGIHYIALTWFVLEITGSGTVTGLVLFFSTIPSVLIGPFGGVVADRINRKFLIVGMDLARSLVVLWLSWIVYMDYAGFFHLAVATVLLAISGAFFDPAVSATLPNLVRAKDLQRANSMEHFSANFTQIIGGFIGGILLGVVGVYGVFLINGISYFLSAISELFINIPATTSSFDESSAENEVSFVSDFKFGIKYLQKRKDIFTLFSFAILVNFLFAGTLMVGLPYLYKEILAVGSNLYGIGQAIFPAGAVAGALILSFLPEVKDYYKLLITTMPVMGICLFGIGISIFPDILTTYSITLIYGGLTVILFIFGVVNAIANIPLNVLLQKLVPDNLRGRILGLITSFHQACVPISMALVGILLDQIQPHVLFVSVSVVWFLVIFIATRVPILRTIGQNIEVEKEAAAANI